MEYNKGFFEEENIPDFALQPAKPASAFDTTVYDKLFETKDQPAEAAAQIDEIGRASCRERVYHPV